MSQRVVLGEQEYMLVPQRHARLRRQLGGLLSNLGDLGDLEIDSPNAMIDLIGEKVYDLLAIFIPEIMPRYEFMGYASTEAMDADRYDEEADRSPTQPEIIDAVKIGMAENGFDWIGSVKDFIGTDFLRAQLRVRLAQWATDSATKTSTPLPNSLSPNGESDLTSTSASEPTPVTPKTSESPSLASVD